MINTIIMTAILLTAGCSSRDKLEVKKKAESSNVTNSTALGQTITQAINSSEHLNGKQKKELELIIGANKKKAEALSAESFRYRGVLIEELLKGSVDNNKIKILKKNIKRIEQEKLDNTFNTIEDISKVVSKNPDKKSFTQPLQTLNGLNR